LSRPRTVLLSLGSNLDPGNNIIRTLDCLHDLVGVEKASHIYSAEPVGSPGPRFLNAAVRITSTLDPLVLKFGLLRPLEVQLGRIRTDNRGAPRTADIDISIVEGLRADHPDLKLPDPDTLSCAHVAIPLADVAPYFVHPVAGVTLLEIADGLRGKGQVKRLRTLNWHRQ